MTRYHANEVVTPGVYFDARHLRFRNQEEAGRLPDDGGVYRRVPTVVLLIAGPLIGLAYVVFLPLIGFIAVGSLIVETVRDRLRPGSRESAAGSSKEERKGLFARLRRRGRHKAA